MKRDAAADLQPADPRAGSIESPLYYPWFDWLRVVCASVVVVGHDSALRWEHAGNLAVQVFFALSGWLIGGILLNAEPRGLPRFYFNRAIRIWVPYYVAVALLLSIAVWRDPLTSKWLEIVAYKLTFVYNLFGTRQLAEFVQAMPEKGTLSHVWSVNAEEQFYLLAPLLLVVGARHAGRSITVWAAISLAAFVFVPIYAAITLGVLAAIVARRHGELHLRASGRAIIAVVLALGVAGLALDLHYDTFAPIASIAVVLLLAMPGRQHPGGALWGGMSYPLYLNHWIALYAANAIGLRHPIRHALVLALAIAIAMGLYWWIDRHLLARRSRLYTPARGRALTLAAYATVALGIGLGLALWHPRP